MSEWIQICGRNKFACSACGGIKPRGVANYCPSCGERMSMPSPETNNRTVLVLPCKVGDTVMAYLDDAPVKGRSWQDLSECVISEIGFHRDYSEPLFTALCYEKASYDRFWLSDFGKLIFTLDQYWALAKSGQNGGNNV